MTPATVVRRDDSLTSDDSMTDFLDLHSRGDLKVKVKVLRNIVWAITMRPDFIGRQRQLCLIWE